ncbi:MAG: glutaredoxin 3 [Rickettsiales bacterium]|jgi:glutaredoxin 3
MKNVEVYTSKICPYCVRAKKMLNDRDIPYKEIKIDSAQLMEEMLIRSGGRKTVPQIFIDDKHIGGSDDLYEYFNNSK